MENKQLERINALAKKSREVGLTPQEKEEQAALRQEYIKGFRNSLTSQLENMVIVEPDGTRCKVTKKQPAEK